MAVLDDYQHLDRDFAHWDSIRGAVEVDVYHGKMESVALAKALSSYDIVALLRERSQLTEAILDQLPRLKLIVVTGPRTDAVDLEAASRRRVTVCATRHSMTSTIEFVWGLILACSRRIPQWDVCLRAGGWQPDARVSPIGAEITGKTLGIYGLGEIGTAVARIAPAFDMEVIAWSENLTPNAAAGRGARYVERDELFCAADVLTIHCRLSERTRGTIGAREFGLMKPTAHLINTSRGPVVDEKALVCALAQGRLAGAALDVFDEEPLPPDSPLRSLPNVVLTPHAAALAGQHVTAWFSDMVEDVRAWLDGAPIRVLA